MNRFADRIYKSRQVYEAVLDAHPGLEPGQAAIAKHIKYCRILEFPQTSCSQEV